MPISMGFSSHLWHFSRLLGFSPTCTTVENARQSHLKWPSTIALQSGATPKSSLDHFIVNLWWRQGILHFQKPPSCIHMFAMMIFDDDRSKDGFVDVVLLVTLQAIDSGEHGFDTGYIKLPSKRHTSSDSCGNSGCIFSRMHKSHVVKREAQIVASAEPSIELDQLNGSVGITLQFSRQAIILKSEIQPSIVYRRSTLCSPYYSIL